MSVYAELVRSSGLSRSHELVLAAVPDGVRVLDVGCAAGYLGAALTERGCTVVGVEMDPRDAASARVGYELVIEGDVEDPATVTQLPRDMQVVIFADILEHLRDPWSVLRASRDLLAPGGRVIVSLPNIAHWTARRALLRGDFTYSDFGLFDRTHLRFFTRDSARRLALDAGFEIANESFAAVALPVEHLITRLGVSEGTVSRWSRPLRDRATNRWPELFALQFILTLTPVR
jgi:2-polyprenyl-3-methyl-5-hydroxy-6-metoxy-1,4-benzoquinol methylase